jgi:cytochrome c biogenesis protein
MQSFSTRALELLSSMRFAVSLLTVIAIASIAGTVVRQGEPYANYVNQFGPFWFRAFESIGLYAVYNAPWFVAILAFLVCSVSLCLWRNVPWMLREMGNFRLGKREQSLRLLPQHAVWRTALAPEEVARRAAEHLQRSGFAFKRGAEAGGILLAAKAGSASRLGYVLAHAAVITICIGGLLDSNISLQLRIALGDKRPVAPDVLLSQVPPSARLAPDSLSFRGNVFLPEGQSSDIAVLNSGEGILVQELPYRISLKKFHIEHYSTGQPKLFASDVIVTDKDSGKSFETRIEVNKPLIHRGIAAYQASFDDGGTLVRIAGHHLFGALEAPLALEGRIGEALELKNGAEAYRLELVGFRPFNVENVAEAGAAEAREAGLLERIGKRLGTGTEALARREMRNVGPSFTYRLRDAAGQAREYHNYMLPVRLEGRWMMLTGMRETPNEAFRYLRMPLDEDGRLDSYWLLREALLDERARGEIARRFARAAVTGDAISQTMRERLAESAERTLEMFAVRGYQSVAEFLEQAVPEPEREQAADIYLRVLQGVAWEAWQFARTRAGLAPLEVTEPRAQFVRDALNTLSDSHHYGVPLYLSMVSFDEVKASVFQMTRSPGRNIVYLGCALLVLGIFAMLYVRERRAWLLAKPDGEAILGMACNRRTLDFEQEFERHRAALARALEERSAAPGAAPQENHDGTG